MNKYIHYKFSIYEINTINVLFDKKTKAIYFNFREFCDYMKISDDYYDNFKLNSKVIEYKSVYDKSKCKYADWTIITKFLSSGYKKGEYRLFDWIIQILLFLNPNLDLIGSINKCQYIFAVRLLNFENLNRTDLKKYIIEKELLPYDFIVGKTDYIYNSWFETKYDKVYITHKGLRKLEEMLIAEGYKKNKVVKFLKSRYKMYEEK